MDLFTRTFFVFLFFNPLDLAESPMASRLAETENVHKELEQHSDCARAEYVMHIYEML